MPAPPSAIPMSVSEWLTTHTGRTATSVRRSPCAGWLSRTTLWRMSAMWSASRQSCSDSSCGVRGAPRRSR